MWNELHVSNILQSSVSPSTPPDLQRDGRPYEIPLQLRFAGFGHG